MSSLNKADRDDLSSYPPSVYTMTSEVEREDLPSYDAVVAPELPVPPPRTSREYLFYRGNGITSKAKICSSDGNREHTLDADIHSTRPSTISVHLASSKSPTMGSLVFPATHNDFQVLVPNPEVSPKAPAQNLLTQVKARIGNPHPTTYHFTLPAAPTSQARKVVWTIGSTTSAGGKHPNISYSLTDETTNEPLAFWTTVQNAKHAALLRWYVLPKSEREELIVMMSFVGCMSRLRLKGKEKLDAGSGTVRWNGMWFGAVLGTAAVS